MKKTLAILLSAVMMLGLLAGCGSKTTEQPSTSGTENTETAALNVGVFYYDYSDVYISSVRSSMDEQLKAMGVNYTNYDGAGNQAQQTDQINTAISNGANLLIVNIVETSSPDAAQNAVEAAKTAGIPIIFFNREVSDDVVNSYEKCAFVGTNAPEAGHMQGQMVGEYLLANWDTVDLNGDGKVVVQVDSYTVDFDAANENTDAYYQMAGVTRLSAELSSGGKTYIFLLEDPEGFEAQTGALQYLDGTVPDDPETTDADWREMVYRWTDCPVLTGLDLGGYEGLTLMDDVTGTNQSVLAHLYVGRRGVWDEKQVPTYEGCAELWDTLTAGAVSTAAE